VATDLTLLLVTVDRQNTRGLSKVGADEEAGGGGGFVWNAEEARVDVRGTCWDHRQRCFGAYQDMTDVVNHSVAPHGGHHLKRIGHRLGGKCPGMFGRLRPGGFHVEPPSQNPDNRTMTSACELRRGGVGDQQQSLHFPSRLLS
jgi:hypothetical protein